MIRTPDRLFLPLTVALLTLMAGLQLSSILEESQTFDEAVHLTAGYHYWQTGSFQMNHEHPPLQKLLSAAPLLIWRPELPSDPNLVNDQFNLAKAFLYGGRISADTMLLAGRLPTIALTILLGLALAWWTRRYFGPLAALVAVALFALDPNLIAHGRYITTDLIATLFYFLACAVWTVHLLNPSLRNAFAAGIVLGLALASKYSLIVLLVLLPGLSILRWLQAGRAFPWKRYWLTLGVTVLAAFVTLGAVYGPETIRAARRQNPHIARVKIGPFHYPRHSFFTGLDAVLTHSKDGHPAYLLGEISDKGWWYYFPVAFAVKSTTALLLALLLLLWLAARAFPWVLYSPRKIPFPWLVLVIPPVVFFAVSMTSRINIGVRHLLPVYPFLYALAGAAIGHGFSGTVRRAAVIALLSLQAVEAAKIHPNYLTFFNLVAGGPQAGPRYLLDSNIDWGQDLKRLKSFMDREKLTSVCLEYFGYADPAYYEIRQEYLPKSWDREEMERLDCIGAISVTLLHDLYIPKGSYEWLRRRRPFGTIGNSIYLFDLRKPRTSLPVP